ncbi:MAG: hypothetical protein K6E98_13205 [Lachnospiraceae bacterium]|nr:hypothetical protein [Lachnospiraceae bacterium]
MIISTSNVGMESVRSYSALRMDAYGSSIDAKSTINNDSVTLNDANSKDASLSPTGNFQSSLDNLKKQFEAMTTSRITHTHFEESAMNRIRTECIVYLLRLLFGRETDDDYGKTSLNDEEDSLSSSFTKNTNNGFSPLIGAGNREAHYFSETEKISYNTKGSVITADGRQLNFNLSFEMSRSFEEYYEKEMVFDASALYDPLVINLNTDIASVSDQKFLFDIDSDGVKDNISMPDKGSGFLALDKNGDGVINNGLELFGTSSGDGFKDLKAYDSDNNGWIDEADPIWDKLLVYSLNEDGTSSLYGLSEKGVGAIFLGNVSTDFSLKNAEDNSLNAMIRKTGMFLYENGNAGTIQHLDVAS